MNVTTHRGARYFVTFIDDYSRFTWLFLMKNKSEVFYWFKIFKAMVENQTNSKIQTLNTDRGESILQKYLPAICKNMVSNII